MFANDIKNESCAINLENDILNDSIVKEYMHKLNGLFDSFMLTQHIEQNKMNGPEEQNHIREALRKGYVEMSHINLSICEECEHAEYEAHYTIERLVSGG